MTTPRLARAVRKVLDSAPRPTFLTTETVEAVRGDGRYVVRGRALAPTGMARLRAGDPVLVSSADGRPKHIVAHQWRKSAPPIIRRVVEGVVEELRLLVSIVGAEVRLTDVRYRNGTVAGSLNILTAYHAALAGLGVTEEVVQQVLWGENGKSFAIHLQAKRVWPETGFSHYAPLFVIFELGKSADEVATAIPRATLVSAKQLPFFDLPAKYRIPTAGFDGLGNLIITPGSPRMFPGSAVAVEGISLDVPLVGGVLLTADYEIVVLCRIIAGYIGSAEFHFLSVLWTYLFVVDTGLGGSIAWEHPITELTSGQDVPIGNFSVWGPFFPPLAPPQILRYWPIAALLIEPQELLAWDRATRLPTSIYRWRLGGTLSITQSSASPPLLVPWHASSGDREGVRATVRGQDIDLISIELHPSGNLPGASGGPSRVTMRSGKSIATPAAPTPILEVADAKWGTTRTVLTRVSVMEQPPLGLRHQLVDVVDLTSGVANSALELTTSTLSELESSALIRALTYRPLESTAAREDRPGRDELWTLDEPTPASVAALSGDQAVAWPPASQRGMFAVFLATGALSLLSPRRDGARDADEGKLLAIAPPVTEPTTTVATVLRWRAHRLVHRP